MKFEENTKLIHGDRGVDLLKNLPNLINELANEWHLSNLIPYHDLTYNYILKGRQGEKSIVLKPGISILSPFLNRFSFSDNGSTLVEVALKMAYQYWHNNDQKERRLFLSFEGGYPRDTFGAISVGGSSGFYHSFQELFFKVLTISYHETWDDDKDIEQKEE